MKYLKTYENIKYPDINDYVYVDLSLHPNAIRKNIISQRKNKINPNIYQIIDVYGTDNEYKIDAGIDIWIYRDEIIEYAKTIDELELKMSTNKYNL
jgi:hypothetical protein